MHPGSPIEPNAPYLWCMSFPVLPQTLKFKMAAIPRLLLNRLNVGTLAVCLTRARVSTRFLSNDQHRPTETNTSTEEDTMSSVSTTSNSFERWGDSYELKCSVWCTGGSPKLLIRVNLGKGFKNKKVRKKHDFRNIITTMSNCRMISLTS